MSSGKFFVHAAVSRSKLGKKLNKTKKIKKKKKGQKDKRVFFGWCGEQEGRCDQHTFFYMYVVFEE